MDTANTIVVIEDDRAIAELIEMYLRREGFTVYRATTGERGLAVIGERSPRLVVLDIGLDGAIDGIEVCRRLRETSRVPVMMVTARDDEIDRVIGLEIGADDYLVKPFSPRELVARVRAILRRVGFDADRADPSRSECESFGELEIDRVRHEVRIGGEPISLTAREYDLLDYLASHSGRALSRRQLLDGVWDAAWVGDERTVDVHVRQLRRKLGDALPLDTVRGVGYRLG